MIFALALVLQFAIMPLQSLAADADTTAPTWVAPIDYVALGDSLAAGMDSNGGMGKGYADYLAENLLSTTGVKTFNKGFSYPGYKTTDVLKQLQENATKPVVGFGYDRVDADLHKSIKDAALITISAGANDVLSYITFDEETGKANINTIDLLKAIQQVGASYKTTLEKIYALNPDVHVYVMGYYNPFPHIADPALQQQLTQLLNSINNTIQTGMQGTTAVFVPTGEKIAEHYAAYLPNPQNIHLSDAGYKLVAQQFGNKIIENGSLIPKDLLIGNVKAATTVELNWKAAKDDEEVTHYVIYNGATGVDTVTGDVLTYSVDNLEESKVYTFTVVAVDAAGNRSAVNPSVQVTTGIALPIFSDIATSEFKGFIEQSVALGLIKGHADGTFKPNDQLTRAQAATIITRSLGLQADEAAPFSDIAGYAKETQAVIAAAYKHGIVKGSNGKFNPGTPVTRAQLALMMKRTYEHVTGEPYEATEAIPFLDIAHLDDETKTAISLLSTFKIVNGSSGKYMPGNPTTRGQAAKIFVNFDSAIKQ